MYITGRPELPQPTERNLLELRNGGTALPYHSIPVYCRRQHFAQNARMGAGVREIGEEARMIPVRQRRHNGSLEIL
jgi:hypothetical protein